MNDVRGSMGKLLRKRQATNEYPLRSAPPRPLYLLPLWSNSHGKKRSIVVPPRAPAPLSLSPLPPSPLLPPPLLLPWWLGMPANNGWVVRPSIIQSAIQSATRSVVIRSVASSDRPFDNSVHSIGNSVLIGTFDRCFDRCVRCVRYTLYIRSVFR